MDKKDKDKKPQVDWDTDTILALVYIPPHIPEWLVQYFMNLWISSMVTGRFARAGTIQGAILKDSTRKAVVIFIPDGGATGLRPDGSTLPPPEMVDRRNPFEVKD